MISELLQDRAALYVSGAMTGGERGDFELILEFHDEVRQLVNELQEVGNAILLAHVPANGPAPSSVLKSKILGAIAERPAQNAPEGFVMTGSDRLVQWVNPAFTAMCGYSLDELRGKSLGPILQGEKSDRGAIARMRSALHARRPCRETLVNYHKDGSAYVVDIEITPILDEEQQPLWFVARERKLELPVAA